MFDGVAAKFEVARSDIVCAFIHGTSVENEVQQALNDATLWSFLYQFNNWDSLVSMVYEGTVDGSVYLAPVKRDDCTCPADLWEFVEWDWSELPFHLAHHYTEGSCTTRSYERRLGYKKADESTFGGQFRIVGTVTLDITTFIAASPCVNDMDTRIRIRACFKANLGWPICGQSWTTIHSVGNHGNGPVTIEVPYEYITVNADSDSKLLDFETEVYTRHHQIEYDLDNQVNLIEPYVP